MGRRSPGKTVAGVPVRPIRHHPLRGYPAHLPIFLASCLLLSGCDRPEARAADSASAETAAQPIMVVVPGEKVDSTIPREEAIRRFQAGLPETDALAGGAESRDGLVRAFVAALERSDTASLARLIVSKAEFGWLYYPTSTQGLPPYALGPDLLWFMLRGRSERGIRRVLAKYGGKPLRMVDHHCTGSASREGANSVWGPCLVRRLTARGDTVEQRLFGPILERDGQFKFLSYGSKL